MQGIIDRAVMRSLTHPHLDAKPGDFYFKRLTQEERDVLGGLSSDDLNALRLRPALLAPMRSNPFETNLRTFRLGLSHDRTHHQQAESQPPRTREG
jgi:hypothetical protein